MYQSYPFFLSHRYHWVPTPPRRISLGTAGKAYPAVKKNLVALGSIKNGWWTESNHPNLRIPILKKQEKNKQNCGTLWNMWYPKKFMAKQFIPIFSPTKHSHSEGESRLLQELSGAQCGNQACNRCHIICRNGLPIFHGRSLRSTGSCFRSASQGTGEKWFQGMPNGTLLTCCAQAAVGQTWSKQTSSCCQHRRGNSQDSQVSCIHKEFIFCEWPTFWTTWNPSLQLNIEYPI